MSKRVVIWTVVALAVISTSIFKLSQLMKPDPYGPFTPREVIGKLGQLEPVPQPAEPLPLNRPVRVAIGSLGFASEEPDRRLGDLVLVELGRAPGLTLLERQSLDAVLRELGLSLSGLVRARDAVRVGKLLKADWFILGSGTRLEGTNSLIIRVVDARTGILRDGRVFLADKPEPQLAAEIAGFVRQTRQNAAGSRPQVYLAIGAFQDLSINNRQAGFPSQLRSYLTAAYQRSNVSLLEREAVSTLLQEVRLDLAGLTEEGSTNPPQPMQSAFWLVEGTYASFEATSQEVEVDIEVRRMFGRTERSSRFRDKPGPRLFEQVKTAIDSRLQSPTVWPSRMREARAQLSIGKELSGLGPGGMVGFENWEKPESGKSSRNTMEAIRALETVLLLEPTNREAKMYLAGCLRKSGFRRIGEARDCYREVLEQGVVDIWGQEARAALLQTFTWSSGEERARWFDSAAARATNSSLREFYRQNADLGAREAVIENNDGPKAIEMAEQKLFDAIHSHREVLAGRSGTYSPVLDMVEFAHVFGTNKAEAGLRLAELLPRMKAEFPDLTPYLLSGVVVFQPNTNSPTVGEFAGALDECIEHPSSVCDIKRFWWEIRWGLYNWCFDTKAPWLAVKVMEGERRAAQEGYVDFNDGENIKLAYAYMAAHRWQDALEIFEAFGGRAIETAGDGPWGRGLTPVLTGECAAFCRSKLGLEQVKDARVFDMGSNCVCLHTPSAFATDSQGVWIAREGELLRLNLDLRTNFVVTLPAGRDVPLRCLCVGEGKLWVGTDGAGLIEFDKSTRICQRLTEADGLLMDHISSLALSEGNLWIGYGSPRSLRGAGLGRLELASRRIRSYMQGRLPAQSRDPDRVPPGSTVLQISPDGRGNLWVLAEVERLRKYVPATDLWDSVPQRHQPGDWLSGFAVDSERLIAGVKIPQTEIVLARKLDSASTNSRVEEKTLIVSRKELDALRLPLSTNGLRQWIKSSRSSPTGDKAGLMLYGFRGDAWQRITDAYEFDHPPTAMTLDGSNLWMGGEGFIALFDLNKLRIEKLSRIPARRVDSIQIGGGYIWAQFEQHLHRALLGGPQ